MIDVLLNIADTIRYKGLEFFNRYYSVYDGVVYDNKDPEKRGRLQLKVPALWQDEVHDYWAEPAGLMTGTDAGVWFIPKVGDRVKVVFYKGNQQYPMWKYGDYATTDNDLSSIYNEDGEPTGVIIKTYSGHSLSLIQQGDYVELKHQSGGKVTINTNDLSLTSGQQQVLLDTMVKLLTNNKVVMGTDTASNPLVKGNELDTFLGNLFKVLKSFTTVVSGAAGTVSPATTAALEALEATLNTLKSNRVFTDQ